MPIAARPGFDWSKVAWAAPDEPITDRCSYCGGSLPLDDDPAIALRLFSRHGHAAAFCEACQKDWFGLEGFEGDEPADDFDLTPDDPEHGT